MKDMMPEMSWPKKGDKAFIASAEPRSLTNANIEWVTLLSGDFISMAFKEAGDKVVNNIEAGNEMKHADMYFFPVCYLYRHSIELELKGIIKLGIPLDILSDDDKHKKLLGSHSLCRLWTKSAVVLKECESEEPSEDFKATESLIHQFHQLDKNGQNFRYSRTKTGERTLKNAPKSVDLANLRDTFDGLYNFLTASQDYMAELLSNVGDYGN